MRFRPMAIEGTKVASRPATCDLFCGYSLGDLQKLNLGRAP
jgi:hypothetical protein